MILKKGGVMQHNLKKPTQSSNFEQAINQKIQNYLTTTTARVKAEFIRVAVWLSVVWG
jgi:hypothetical protein